MRRRICICAYNRPHYLTRVVAALRQCRDLEAFEIVGCLDVGPNGEVDAECESLLRSVCGEVRVRSQRQDCNAHVHRCLQEALDEGVDWLLWLEDDVVPARGALEFAMQHEHRLTEDRPSLRLVGENVSREQAQRSVDELIECEYFCAWGLYLSRVGLSRCLEKWQPAWDVETGIAWDDALTRSGWRSLSCVVPRAKNIGIYGRYAVEVSQHDGKIRRFWSDDFENKFSAAQLQRSVRHALAAADDSQRVPHKVDATASHVAGMTSIRIRRFINSLCEGLGRRCCYTEIGTHQGATLVSASHGNAGQFSGLDNFSYPGFDGRWVFETLRENLRRFAPHAQIYGADANESALHFSNQSLSNVVNYDGDHEIEPTAAGICALAQSAQRPFVLLVDDFDWPKVRAGTFKGIDDAGLQILAEWQRDGGLEPSDRLGWWNGFYIAIVDDRQNAPAPITGESHYQGVKMQQQPEALAEIEKILRSERPSRVIELGTGHGGFALFLRDVCASIGCEFSTHDVRAPADEVRQHLPFVELDFHRAEGVARLVPQIGSPGKTILIVDGGDKPLEFNTYAEHLKLGDLLLAHDYCRDREHFARDFLGKLWNWCEITWADVAVTCQRLGLSRCYEGSLSEFVWLAVRRSGA